MYMQLNQNEMERKQVIAMCGGQVTTKRIFNTERVQEYREQHHPQGTHAHMEVTCMHVYLRLVLRPASNQALPILS